MAERATIARPYAKAAFSVAREHNALAAWSNFLHTAAAFVSDARVVMLLSSPNLSEAQRVELVSDLGGKGDEYSHNFLRLLAKNRRLTLLPDIAAHFEMLRADAENTATVDVTSAVALSTEQRDKLAAALKTRLKRDIRMNTTVDASLIGGAVIRCGDLVIDGSLKGRLQQLRAQISN